MEPVWVPYLGLAGIGLLAIALASFLGESICRLVVWAKNEGPLTFFQVLIFVVGGVMFLVALIVGRVSQFAG